MIHKNDLLSLAYYKKAVFSGNMEGLRFRIAKKVTDEETHFLVLVWAGPYILEKSAPESVKEKTFPFCDESLSLIADYLNEQLSLWKNS